VCGWVLATLGVARCELLDSVLGWNKVGVSVGVLWVTIGMAKEEMGCIHRE
jgi:hypothetical protein